MEGNIKRVHVHEQSSQKPALILITLLAYSNYLRNPPAKMHPIVPINKITANSSLL